MKISLEKKNKKLKVLAKKNLRKEKTIKGLLKKLENMKHLTKEQNETLLSNFGHMTRKLFINEEKNAQKSNGSRYGNTIKQFAISLHFYSPKAYQFVRKSLHLPSPATIRSWAGAIDCEPGFLNEVIQHLQDTLAEDNRDCIFVDG